MSEQDNRSENQAKLLTRMDDVVNTSLIPIVYYLERELNEMSPVEAEIIFRTPHPREQRLLLPTFSQAMLARISYLTPLREIATQVDKGFAIRYPLNKGREKQIFMLRNGKYFDDINKTLKESGETFGVKPERFRQMLALTRRVINTQILPRDVSTLTGNKSISQLIEENFAALSEQAAQGKDVSQYQPAPDNYWETVNLLFPILEEDPALQTRWSTMNLIPPSDFIFAQQVIGHIARFVSEEGTEVFSPSRKKWFLRYVRGVFNNFYLQYEDIVGNATLNYTVSHEVRERLESERKRVEAEENRDRLTEDKFGNDDTAARTYNTLKRSGVENNKALLSLSVKELSDIRNVGTILKTRILNYLEANYPEEKLTIELRKDIDSKQTHTKT